MAMNKMELISKISEKSKLTKKDAEVALNALIQTVKEELKAGEKIQLVGFGTFETRHRAERIGRNPRTKEEITIPATIAPAFKPGKELKEFVK